MTQEANAKPEYGIDAPGVIRNLLVGGVASLVVGRFVNSVTLGGITFILKPMFINTGIGCLLAGVLMLLYSKYGKFGHRDRILNALTWRGDERVLDVGTGAGLLLIGAAKRLTTGRAVGIDLWSQVDLSGNGPERVRPGPFVSRSAPLRSPAGPPVFFTRATTTGWPEASQRPVTEVISYLAGGTPPRVTSR